MISDDKVGPNGVKVRCKKCQHVIVVKKSVEPDPTQVMQNPLAGMPGGPQAANGQNGADAANGASGVFGGGIGLDEIGQAFDSVLSTTGPQPRPDTNGVDTTMPAMAANSAEAAAAAASVGMNDPDRESTRVMDVRSVNSLVAKTEERTEINQIPDGLKAAAILGTSTNKATNGVNGHANGSASSGEVPQTDWYVAIDDEQQGPVTLDFVKKVWEEGRVTTDSLVWRNGYGDWRPLSTVPDLVKVLTPIIPRKQAAKPAPAASEGQPPAGATASGPQVPWQPGSSTPAPAAVPDPDEVDWKPAAASALASLVKDEMEALAKPPKKEELPKGGLLGVAGESQTNLPTVKKESAEPKNALDSVPSLPSIPVVEPASRPEDSMPMVRAAKSAAPALAPEPSVSVNMNPIPAVLPSTSSSMPAASSRPHHESNRIDRMDVPVYPPPSTYIPPTPANNTAKYVVIGVSVIGVCAMLLGVVYMVTHSNTDQHTDQHDLHEHGNQLAVNTNDQPPVHVNPPVANTAPVVAPTAPTTPTNAAVAPTATTAVANPASPTGSVAPSNNPNTAVAMNTHPNTSGSSNPSTNTTSSKDNKDNSGDSESSSSHHKRRHHDGNSDSSDSSDSNSSDNSKSHSKSNEVAKADTSSEKDNSSSTDPLGSVHNSKVDDEFRTMFEDKKPPDDSGSKQQKKKDSGGYIPPSLDSTQNLPDTLGQGDIMQVVAGHKSNIKKCVDEQKAKDPDSTGKIMMNWTIQKNGSVSNVQCGTDEFKSSAMAKCMTREIATWKFPQFKGSPIPVPFPFKF
jgi:hypothetical protein